MHDAEVVVTLLLGSTNSVVRVRGGVEGMMLEIIYVVKTSFF